MEEQVQISVQGVYSPQYALVIDHEGYTPVTAGQIQVRNRLYLKDIIYATNKRVDRDAIEFAVRHLKQPFFVIPNSNDLISNSGMHSVQLSDSLVPARGLYVLEKELEFPRPRPRMDDLEKLKRELDFIAWVVGGDEVFRLWILRFVRSPDHIKLTIPEDEFEQFEQLQGNLYYAPISINEETKSSLPWRQLRIFNHKFDYVYAVSFVYDNGVYAILHTYSNTCVRSTDHPEVTLKRGSYLLYHPFPHPRRDD